MVVTCSLVGWGIASGRWTGSRRPLQSQNDSNCCHYCPGTVDAFICLTELPAGFPDLPGLTAILRAAIADYLETFDPELAGNSTYCAEQ
jgi:hypothetical protein